MEAELVPQLQARTVANDRRGPEGTRSVYARPETEAGGGEVPLTWAGPSAAAEVPVPLHAAPGPCRGLAPRRRNEARGAP